MNNTSAIKHRMKSIKQTVQISTAQKLVASSHIGKARLNLQKSRPYHERIRKTIAQILSAYPGVSSLYLNDGKTRYSKRGLIVITSNKGLAGSFNSNVIRFTQEVLQNNSISKLIVLGNVGRNAFSHLNFTVDDFQCDMEEHALFSSRELSEHILELLAKGSVDSFDIIYTSYISAVKCEVVMERLFPLQVNDFGPPEENLSDVLFEPSAHGVFSTIFPKYLKGYIYGSLVHSFVSELSCRVTAMDNAVRNGNEMLDKLAKVYNRLRQGIITAEITEIVAGASSMLEE